MDKTRSRQYLPRTRFQRSERERASRTLNVVVLGALRKLQGKETPLSEHEVGERIEGLRPCGRVLRELANSADEGFTEPARPLNLYAHTREGAEEEDPDKTARLRSQLAKLERLPENEAIRFQIESELYKLENGDSDAAEWPEVIGDNCH